MPVKAAAASAVDARAPDLIGELLRRGLDVGVAVQRLRERVEAAAQPLPLLKHPAVHSAFIAVNLLDDGVGVAGDEAEGAADVALERLPVPVQEPGREQPLGRHRPGDRLLAPFNLSQKLPPLVEHALLVQTLRLGVRLVDQVGEPAVLLAPVLPQLEVHAPRLFPVHGHAHLVLVPRQAHGDAGSVDVRQPLAPRLAQLPFGPGLDRATHRRGEVQVIGDVRQPDLPPVPRAKNVHLPRRLFRGGRLARQHEGLRSPRSHDPAAQHFRKVRRSLALDPAHAPALVRGVQPLVQGSGHDGVSDAGDNLGGAAAVDDQPLNLGEPSLPDRLHPVPFASRREPHRARLPRAPLAAVLDAIDPRVPRARDLNARHPGHDFVSDGSIGDELLHGIRPRVERDGLLHGAHARDDLLGARELILAGTRGGVPGAKGCGDGLVRPNPVDVRDDGSLSDEQRGGIAPAAEGSRRAGEAHAPDERAHARAVYPEPHHRRVPPFERRRYRSVEPLAKEFVNLRPLRATDGDGVAPPVESPVRGPAHQPHGE